MNLILSMKRGRLYAIIVSMVLMACLMSCILATESKEASTDAGATTDKKPAKAGEPAIPTQEFENVKEKEKFAFETEVNKMMKIIINSLYKTKEVFLRELISNASDALDKIRFLSLTDKKQLETNPGDLKVMVATDPVTRTLTITDNGIGMTKKTLKENLGTIAKSGTSEFMAALAKNASDSNLIGQFGVGFYSAFLVADRVTVISKHNDDDQYVWESDSANDYRLFKDPRGNTLKRGTSIILHLKDDALEFLDDNKLKKLIKRYSEFINFPIYMWTPSEITEEVEDDDESADSSDVEDVTEEKEKKKKTVTKTVTDWELINDSKPIWARNPSDVTKDEYISFYRSFFHVREQPGPYNHFKGEGEAEFRAILFFPLTAPPRFLEHGEDHPKDVKLFSKRVFITDQLTELLPGWLRFLRAVVDADDLTLNVSRDTLQNSAIIKLIKKKLVSKALETIKKLSQDPERVAKWEEFWGQYRHILKHGLATDPSSKKKLLKLVRFESSTSNFTSLDEYKSRMKKKQPQIYFITASTPEDARSSPLLEAILGRGYEVLYLTDPIDEYLINGVLKSYDGTPLQHIGKDGLKFGDEDQDKDEEKAQAEKYKDLISWLREKLEPYVSEVRISKTLTKSACAVKSGPYDYSASQERMMKAQLPEKDPRLSMMKLSKRIFEINPYHPIINGLLEKIKNGKGKELENVPYVLFESAAIGVGYDPRDPPLFASQVDKVLRLFVGVDLNKEAQVKLKPAEEKDEKEKEEERKKKIAEEKEAEDDEKKGKKEDTEDDEFPAGFGSAIDTHDDL